MIESLPHSLSGWDPVGASTQVYMQLGTRGRYAVVVFDKDTAVC